MASGVKPTKGVKPNFTGVAGSLLAGTEVPHEVIFGATLRTSPYDVKLKELASAAPGSVLCFGDPRARPSLYSRSKKLAMKLEFGEHAGKLYVRLAGPSLASSPAPSEPSVKDVAVSDHKIRNRAAILSAMRSGATTPEAIAARIRKQDESMSLDGPIVRSLLKGMQSTGSVVLKKITPETWEIAGSLV